MDLFSHLPGSEIRLTLPDADVQLVEHALSETAAQEALADLLSATPWEAKEVVVWGKRHLQPRLVAWYGDPGTSYTYSGSSLEPLPWTPRLLDLRRTVQDIAGTTFNSVLLNLYRDERDGMGWHSDNEPELGPEPVIASLSLGEQRAFQMKHKTRQDVAPVTLQLPHGSLLVMQGPTQRFWKHALRKETGRCGPRVNLTFRTIHHGVASE